MACILLIFYFAFLIPLLFFARTKTKPEAIILTGIFFGPLIGWIMFLLLDDARPKSHGISTLNGGSPDIPEDDPESGWGKSRRS